MIQESEYVRVKALLEGELTGDMNWAQYKHVVIIKMTI